MSKISMELIQQLRDRTGVGMMDCKKALEESNGNIEKAVDYLRKKGAAVAEKRSGNATSEGIVHAYIHPGSRIGVLVEINCETDFVARTPALTQFAQDIGMQIAAVKPLCVIETELDPALIEREKAIYAEQLKGKPAQIMEQIIKGKLEKFYAEKCLLYQTYIKNDKITVHDLLKELIAKMGESIKIKRFCRFEIGA